MWARIDNGKAAEFTDTNPAGRFHPSLIWVACPSDTVAGSTYAAGAFTAPTVPPAQAAPTQITPLQFRDRFTASELTAIQTAALGNATLFGWLLQAASAQYVDLADPLTKGGLDALVTAGLLTASRETAILTP